MEAYENLVSTTSGDVLYDPKLVKILPEFVTDDPSVDLDLTPGSVPAEKTPSKRPTAARVLKLKPDANSFTITQRIIEKIKDARCRIQMLEDQSQDFRMSTSLTIKQMTRETGKREVRKSIYAPRTTLTPPTPTPRSIRTPSSTG